MNIPKNKKWRWEYIYIPLGLLLLSGSGFLIQYYFFSDHKTSEVNFTNSIFTQNQSGGTNIIVNPNPKSKIIQTKFIQSEKEKDIYKSTFVVVIAYPAEEMKIQVTKPNNVLRTSSFNLQRTETRYTASGSTMPVKEYLIEFYSEGTINPNDFAFSISD